ITDHPIITNIADWFYLGIQKFNRRLAVRSKRSCKAFLRSVERVRIEAIDFGRIRRADLVVCGHTHHAEAATALGPTGDWPAYFNTGCWTDHSCHYWTVKDGDTQLHEIKVGKVLSVEANAIPNLSTCA